MAQNPLSPLVTSEGLQFISGAGAGGSRRRLELLFLYATSRQTGRAFAGENRK